MPVQNPVIRPYPEYYRNQQSNQQLHWFRKRTMLNLFLVAVIVRVLAAVLITAYFGSMFEISRDSHEYHDYGLESMQRIVTGTMEPVHWVDDGWKQLIGLMYYLLTPNILIVSVFNALLSGFAVVLMYKICLAAFHSETVGIAAAYLVALFPSSVYFTSLPLKEAIAMFAILSVIWGVQQIKTDMKFSSLIWVALGLVILVGVRTYLSIVITGCVLLCAVKLPSQNDIKAVLAVGVWGLCLLAATIFIVNSTGIELREYESLQYFDLDRLNEIRQDMTSGGKSRMFAEEQNAGFDDDVFGNASKLGKGLFYFFSSIDITNIRRSRQLAALPEMCFFLVGFFPLIRGLKNSWRTNSDAVFPLIVIGFVLIVVYSSATTNMGALYRWRLQALPVLLAFVCNGVYTGKHGVFRRILMRFCPRYARQERGVTVG